MITRCAYCARSVFKRRNPNSSVMVPPGGEPQWATTCGFKHMTALTDAGWRHAYVHEISSKLLRRTA